MVKVKGVKLRPRLEVGEYHLKMKDAPSDIYRIWKVSEEVEAVGFIRVEIKWEKREEAGDVHLLPQDINLVVLSGCDAVPMDCVKKAIMETII